MQPMMKYAKNGMFEAIINHESEQIRPLDNAYTDILNKAVKIRSTRANQLAELAHQAHQPGWDVYDCGAFVLALVMTLITFMVLRRIVIRPLQEHAAQRIEKIASGDLTMNDEPAGRNEIGRLSRDFTANAAFTGDDSRSCSTGRGRDLSWHQRNFRWQCGPFISHRRTSSGD
ncbi:HAMP domain-containing protein [Escherichia coli]